MSVGVPVGYTEKYRQKACSTGIHGYNYVLENEKIVTHEVKAVKGILGCSHIMSFYGILTVLQPIKFFF